MATEQQKREEEIEKLARETGRLIREADPEIQEELREAAAAVMREEARESAATLDQSEEPRGRHSMNPLAAGLGLVLIGGGLSFIIPPVGLALLAAGIIAVIWGAVISFIRK